MNKKERQMQINDGLRECFDPMSRKLVNFIPIRLNQSKEHFLKICETCFDYAKQNNDFAILVDAKLKNGAGRPDVLVLYPDTQIIEIADSEDEQSIQQKIEKYPPAWNVEVVRCE